METTNDRFGSAPPQLTSKEKETQKLPLVSDSILPLINQQHDNLLELASYVKAKNLKTGSLFLPQTLKDIDLELTNREGIILDCLNYLDIISVYSLTLYGETDIFFNKIIESIIENRISTNFNMSILKDTVTDFIFSSSSDARVFLHSNKILIAIYIFILIETIFYNNKSD